MEYTSAQANKLLRQLQEDHAALITREAQSRKFVAATVEDPEQARPEYDYDETQARLALLERQIRTVKHAINAFNLTHCPEELARMPLTSRSGSIRSTEVLPPSLRVAD